MSFHLLGNIFMLFVLHLMLNSVCRCIGGDTGVSGQGFCGSFLVHLRLDLSDRRARVSALQHAATPCSTAAHCRHQHTAQTCNALLWMFGLFCLTTGRSAHTEQIVLHCKTHCTSLTMEGCRVRIHTYEFHCNTLRHTARTTPNCTTLHQ